jgi:hypothetical protein
LLQAIFGYIDVLRTQMATGEGIWEIESRRIERKKMLAGEKSTHKPNLYKTEMCRNFVIYGQCKSVGEWGGKRLTKNDKLLKVWRWMLVRARWSGPPGSSSIQSGTCQQVLRLCAGSQYQSVRSLCATRPLQLHRDDQLYDDDHPPSAAAAISVVSQIFASDESESGLLYC